MMSTRAVSRSLTLAVSLLLALTGPAVALAASITGTVTNKTTNKPAAGDEVVLLQLQNGMNEAGSVKTDSKGHFSLDLPDAGPHLIRVEHQKGSYYRQAPPGTQSVDIDVYDVAAKVSGISTEANVVRVEADNSGLKVTENYFVKNTSAPPRTQYSDRAFEVYLPADMQIEGSAAMAPGGMPVSSSPVPLGDKGHYAFDFPIRPGETRFQVSYHIPYSGSYKFTRQVSQSTENIAVMLPKSMKFTPGSASAFQSVPEDPNAQTFLLKNVSPGHPVEFTVAGTGSLPRDTQAPDAQGGGDASGAAAGGGAMAGSGAMGGSAASAGNGPGGGLGVPVSGTDVLQKYRWWILGGLSIVLAVAAGFLLRKPATPLPARALASAPTAASLYTPASTVLSSTPAAAHSAANPSASQGNTILALLKDELFAIETEHLEGKLSAEEYGQLKPAFQTVLRRVLGRSS